MKVPGKSYLPQTNSLFFLNPIVLGCWYLYSHMYRQLRNYCLIFSFLNGYYLYHPNISSPVIPIYPKLVAFKERLPPCPFRAKCECVCKETSSTCPTSALSQLLPPLQPALKSKILIGIGCKVEWRRQTPGHMPCSDYRIDLLDPSHMPGHCMLHHTPKHWVLSPGVMKARVVRVSLR